MSTVAFEGEGARMARAKPNHFGYFNSWPKATRLAVTMCAGGAIK
jgi:hypothetical protein